MLRADGVIHLATDVTEYYEDWLDHLPLDYVPIQDDPWVHMRHLTKYQQRGLGLGHTIREGVWRLRQASHHDAGVLPSDKAFESK